MKSTNVQEKIYQCLKYIQFRISPGTCLICKKDTFKAEDLCSNCESSLPWLRQACQRCALPLPVELKTTSLCGRCQFSPPLFNRCISPFLYEPPVNQLISQYKFFGKLYAGRFLTKQLNIKLIKDLTTFPEIIIPMPLHTKSMRKRGFNQALEISRYLSKFLAIPFSDTFCSCIKYNISQKKLSAEQRKHNLRQTFKVDDPNQILKGKHIALVDDVVTTMSTANTLSKLLLENGVASIQLWCLARTDRH